MAEPSVNHEPLVDRLKAHLRLSMKSRDVVATMTLRTMLSALDNATAVEVDPSYVPMSGRTPDVPRRQLSEHEQIDLLHGEAEGRRRAMHQYEQLGKDEEVKRLRRELEVFALYLDGSRQI